MGTFIVGAILLVIVGAVIYFMVRSKKQGKSSCGCGCANCALHDSCHNQK